MAEFRTAVPYVSSDLVAKSTVVYPAIRSVPSDPVRQSSRDTINLLFSGFFFRKGGASVVDAFCTLQKQYPGVRLRLCCDPRTDFETSCASMRDEYLAKIDMNPAIKLGRVSRIEMIERVLPETDVFVMPTYNEAFGFAILEAMAQGIPVVSTRHFAIPEMVEHDRSGFLIDFGSFDVAKLFPGYVVDQIPADFHASVTEQLESYLSQLIGSKELRGRFSARSLEIVASKFSIERRNQVMLDIYRNAIK
ncbi:glycosyltransferase family 4 protein [Allorhodopirellula solitaria]|nr:glycosyltransferase family 4 protein [Allorhodopirellula solitaria]